MRAATLVGLCTLAGAAGFLLAGALSLLLLGAATETAARYAAGMLPMTRRLLPASRARPESSGADAASDMAISPGLALPSGEVGKCTRP